MKRLPVLSLFALLAPVPAQTGTLPPGFDTRTSSGVHAHSWLLGRYRESRHQLSYGDITGKGAVTMTEISFRQDDVIASNTSVARSWKNLSVSCVETRIDKLDLTWSKNYVTTPTMVYSGPASWPDLTSAPTSKPAPWDKGGLKIPFRTKFIYSGKNDVLFDMTFTGGVLGNNAPWSGSSGFSYYLDGRTYITSSFGSLATGGRTGKCTVDSSSPGTIGPIAGFWIGTYAKNTGSPKTSDKFGTYGYVAGFPGNILVLQGVSLSGTRQLNDPSFPVVPGLGCQNLLIRPSAMMVIPHITKASGWHASSTQFVPFVSSAVNLHVYSQSIWTDTGTMQPKLSRVGDTTILKQPGPADFSGRFAYNYKASAATSFPPGTYYVPVIRYK